MIEILKEKKIKLTKPRHAILEILKDHHYTLNQIYQQLKLKGFHNLATVYNNLDFLLEKN